ncbi:MAG TPA: hypothetical protein VF190_01150 [Rhodothermales bacterium]
MKEKEAEINYTKEAFLNPWNLAFLIMAMLTAFFLSGHEVGLNLVLIMAAAAELMYLGIMPRQERFQRVIRSRRAQEHAKPPSQKEIFQLLTRYSQRRYARLRKIEKDIAANYRKLSYASQGLLNSHLSKIDGLLDSYLNLLYQEERYEHYQHTASEKDLCTAIDDIKADMSDDPPRVKAIKQRRLRILQQRLERLKKSGENLDIIKAQLATIEDVTKYIHEQSLTLRNPEEITFQLDMLLSEVEETEATVEHLEEIFSQPVDLLADMDTFESEETREKTDEEREAESLRGPGRQRI